MIDLTFFLLLVDGLFLRRLVRFYGNHDAVVDFTYAAVLFT
jgi:hypothetical protein